MADNDKAGVTDADNLSGSGLQQSQLTGAGGAGMTRANNQGETGGAQLGGGPSQSDMASPGGSSGSGGYGNDQQSANDQGQQFARQSRTGHDEGQSRGERWDEEQGGGRAADSVSSDTVAQAGGGQGSFDQHTDSNALERQADELLRDQQEHQDRGQSDAADFEADAQS
jgi:hypothetical protein